MTYLEFYDKMSQYSLVSSNWKNLLSLLKIEVGIENNDMIMKLFVLYFSLIDEGNTYMPLDADVLENHFQSRIDGQKALLKETDYDENSGNNAKIQTLENLEQLRSEISEIVRHTGDLKSCNIIGFCNNDAIDPKGLFMINNERMFARKYYNSVNTIISLSKVLFKNTTISSANIDYLDTIGKYKLKGKQREAVLAGLNKNILLTGGPGTGKTFTIFYLLIALLKANKNYHIYLSAPSGKAADRMGESIKKNIEDVSDAFKNENKDIIDIIASLEGMTIHRLLDRNFETNGFKYNKDNHFPENSIFVIDEASMIDVCLFSSLLEAIPEKAKVFILGDKNQLPSVECGAVFADLLELYNENVIELTESNRFSNDSKIYKLAEKVNSGSQLELSDEIFFPIDGFTISNSTNEILYYSDAESNKKITEKITDVWYPHFFSNLPKMCDNLAVEDFEKFKSIIQISETAKILCALNDTTRGANHINELILNKYYSNQKKISGFYVGEILMITRNLRSLDLFNGDCGVTVRFKDDDTLYLMLKKNTQLNLNDGKRDNNIFKLGDYLFYPIRLIGRADISSAFAISIHKSQGSDYENILVILPRTEGHPLLNRQIVYTGITRTKGNTYILSNSRNMQHAANTALIRSTGIADKPYF